MNWMSIKVIFGRFLGCAYLQFVYRWWSRLYRFIWEYKFSKYSVNSYKNMDDLVKVIRTCRWTADGAKQLWDAISRPGKVQYIIDTEPEDKRFIGDCDEFGIYIANALEKSVSPTSSPFLEAYKGLYVDRARLLTVMWVDKEGKYGGHNVCLINWFDPTSRLIETYSFMDYNYPEEKYMTTEFVVESVMRKYASGGICLGWAIHDKDLNLEEMHWG